MTPRRLNYVVLLSRAAQWSANTKPREGLAALAAPVGRRRAIPAVSLQSSYLQELAAWRISSSCTSVGSGIALMSHRPGQLR